MGNPSDYDIGACAFLLADGAWRAPAEWDVEGNATWHRVSKEDAFR